jgi:hypothetical protein
MFRKICLVSALCLAGCASHSTNGQVDHSTPTIHQSVAEVNSIPTQPKPIPIDTTNWVAIKGKVRGQKSPSTQEEDIASWSVLTPPSFKDSENIITQEQRKELNVLFILESKESGMRIMFVQDPTTEDLETYTRNMAHSFQTSGYQIIAAKRSGPSGGISGLDTTLLVLAVSKDVISLHFIAIDDGSAYNFACGTPLALAHQNSATCMSIAKSIKITH